MQDIWIFLQHHELLTSALVAILIVLVIVEFLKIRRGTHQLSPMQVTQLINHENAAIVDVRSLDAYTNGHIVNAISLPAQQLAEKIKKIEKFKALPVIVVCAMGRDSAQASTTLMNHGFTRVYILNGGIQAWKTADMPLVK